MIASKDNRQGVFRDMRSPPYRGTSTEVDTWYLDPTVFAGYLAFYAVSAVEQIYALSPCHKSVRPLQSLPPL